MTRRSFPLVAAAAAAAGPGARAALLTHADGPHLSNYLPALANTAEAHSVVLADPSGTVEPEARKALGAKLTAVYRDPAELLRKEKPEFALVTMEAVLSPPVIRQALEAGCHVLAEKPACVGAADFDALAAVARARQRQFILAFANRLDPAVLEARRLMREGITGKVYGVEMNLVADQTRLARPAHHRTWFAQKGRAGGGHLAWLGVHWLDLAAYLTGLRITHVAGFTANVGGQPLDVEDSAAVTLRFDNGSLGTLTSGYYVRSGYHSMVKIWGADGWLELRKHGAPVPLEWSSNAEGKVRQLPTALPEVNVYEAFVRRAVRAALGLEEPVIATADCQRAIRTVFAAYEAAATGRTQPVGG